MNTPKPALRPVLRDEPIPQQAEGTFGVVRKPAPADGLLLEVGEEPPAFFSLEEIAEAAKGLRKKQRERDGR